MRKACAAILLILILCWSQGDSVADISSQPENEPGAEVPIVENAPPPDFETALRGQMHVGAEIPQVRTPAPDQHISPLTFESLALGALLSFLFVLRIIRFLHRAPGAPKPASAIEVVSNLLAEDEAFASFMRNMEEGPSVQESPAAEASELPAEKKLGPLEKFLEDAPKRIIRAQEIFSEIGRAGDASARHGILERVFLEMDWLKNNSGLPELLPAWQTAAALEGLLKQLTRNASNVTPSSL
jgi:hypothetical protein